MAHYSTLQHTHSCVCTTTIHMYQQKYTRLDTLVYHGALQVLALNTLPLHSERHDWFQLSDPSCLHAAPIQGGHDSLQPRPMLQLKIKMTTEEEVPICVVYMPL